ncbi:MAG: bifunctional DNA-formamidopyrimidine glycosylase/DNA-(apurinic or apyrimidinic site) lyase [Gammaproteobacteria bacterium]|nr:bifunctional DNA-formamidopyrimidine glycosylase/DNA-(apurinic or apyrimidinic site) lyase [Gammaproteobacteria bacterium]
MPELPEVQTTVTGLQHYIEGQIMTDVVFHRNTIRYPLEAKWIDKMRGQTIKRIYRRAKIIVMQLESGYLLWHLGMTGSLRVSPKNEEKRKHDHIECMLNGGRVLRFHDPRRFGYLKWFPSEQEMQNSIAHYGIEPLADEFDSHYLWSKSRNKQQAVKNFIMDQTIVVGVGNIYACEALFLSGIHPQKKAGQVSKLAYKKLVKNIKLVLEKAILQGGTTINDFENADAKPGYFQQSLAVYGKEGQSCNICSSSIETIKLGGRNSFYCPKCQK